MSKLSNVDINEKYRTRGTRNVKSLYRVRSMNPLTLNRQAIIDGNRNENNELRTCFSTYENHSISPQQKKRKWSCDNTKHAVQIPHVKFPSRGDVCEKWRVSEYKYSLHSQNSQAYTHQLHQVSHFFCLRIHYSITIQSHAFSSHAANTDCRTKNHIK